MLPYGATASGSNCTAPSGQPNMALHVQSTQFGANVATPFTMSATQTAVVMDDFDKDGFEDLFIMSNAEALAATPFNVANINAGFHFGPVTALGSTPGARTDPVSGDFNYDGLVDVAWIADNNRVYFATVCPGSVANTMDHRQLREIILNHDFDGFCDRYIWGDPFNILLIGDYIVDTVKSLSKRTYPFFNYEREHL